MSTESKTAVTVIRCALLIIAATSSVSSQQPGATSAAPGASEFPVIMRQNITAGKTQVGTRVQAELVIATMSNGTVVPRGAILTGEVTQSVAKSKSEPSRLSIRIDSAQWKGGSAPLKVYLTAWYYPEVAMPGQDISYQPPDANGKRTWNGQGAYPDPGNPASQEKFPGRDGGKDSDNGTLAPAYRISKHRTLLKHIESERNSDGIITLSSSLQNIKINQLTTYVLANGDLVPIN